MFFGTDARETGWKANIVAIREQSMKKLLVLARGAEHVFTNLAGESILKDFPVPVVVFAEKTNVHVFDSLQGDVAVEIVRYYDAADIHSRAARLHEEHGLSGIAVLTEESIELAADLREKLNLPGTHPEAAKRFRNKMLMKEVLGAAGVRVPENAECIERAQVERLLNKHQRLVIKPVDGFGSKEVVFIDSVAELNAWYENGKAKGFQAEEYIEGTLYHVNAVVRNGEAILTASAPYLPGMGNIDFSSGAPFVSVMLTSGELKDRLEVFSNDVIRILGMHDGVTHLEVFLKPDGEIVFCEVGARPGGGGIVLMIEAQYGVNFARASLLLQAGRGDLVTLEQRGQSNVVGLMGFRHTHSSFIVRIAKPEAFNEDWIHFVKIGKQEGDFAAASGHCTDFIGLLIFSAADFSEFERQRVNLQDRFYSALETRAV
jgi:biotin carboxylase